MKLDNQSGWLLGVRHHPSPNCDERPCGVAIDLLVIHGISLPPGQYGGDYIDQFFTNSLDSEAHPYFTQIANLRVSAHALINRKGNITQYVPFTARAWHAGESEFCGQTCCNDFSIGIELEGSDEEPYTGEQYRELARLCRCLMKNWPGITRERIVGHSDIAPGRKTDPGPLFEWQLLNNELDKA
ncbi:MAG: 1,6-anhydro-N-acetylmuramyl-L-alanine amidase AmpD [Gammaproteobacteria bacterium]